MKRLLLYTLSVLLYSCSTSNQSEVTESEKDNVIQTDEFEIHYAKEQAATLFVFPCFTCDLEHTKSEFKVLDSAYENGISVVLLNFNLRLTLDTNELKMLTTFVNDMINYYQLPTEQIYFGGYSGGGNVALLLANHLTKEGNTYLPSGVFAVDPPIDLWNIYQSSLLNVERNFSEPSVAESTMLIDLLDSLSGEKSAPASAFNSISPIVNATNTYTNLNDLKSIKIRLYTEPDSIWWKENRQADFNQTNSYALRKFVKNQQSTFQSLTLIETQNSGYRADGRRHPHSWSIVDIPDLITWIKTPL